MSVPQRQIEVVCASPYEDHPAGFDFLTRRRYWQRRTRELQADLNSAIASGRPDAGVVRADLHAAQRHMALLTDLVRRAA